MLQNTFSYNVAQFIAQLAIMAPAFLVSLSFHEFAHAITATLFGDDTPRKHGRLTLNPLAHVDPLGLLFLVLFRFGWAYPVPFDERNFKHPRLYSVVTALAGPIANFILALLCFYIVKLTLAVSMARALSISLVQIFTTTAYLNVALGVFNLLPIPPLDGSHLLMIALRDRAPKVAEFIHSYSFFILIFIFLFPPFHKILAFLMMVVSSFLQHLVF